MLALDDPTPIKLNGVSFSYDPEPLLEDVTLNLSRGDVTLTSGPNGSVSRR